MFYFISPDFCLMLLYFTTHCQSAINLYSSYVIKSILFHSHVIQTSGEAHSLQRQPWDQAPDPRAVPYTPSTEGGVYTTPASQTEGKCGKATAQVSLFLYTPTFLVVVAVVVV